MYLVGRGEEGEGGLISFQKRREGEGLKRC